MTTDPNSSPRLSMGGDAVALVVTCLSRSARATSTPATVRKSSVASRKRHKNSVSAQAPLSRM